MNIPDGNETIRLLTEGAVIAAAGYIGAWFAAGPNSALYNPVAGAVMALGTRVTYAILGRGVFEWAQRQNGGNTNNSLTTAVIVSFTGGLVSARCCGYAVGPSDITVLFIGLCVGLPVAVIGYYFAVMPLSKLSYKD